jgi:hypothetical protein
VRELVSGRLLLSGATVTREQDAGELTERLQNEVLKRTAQFGWFGRDNGSMGGVCDSPRPGLGD